MTETRWRAKYGKTYWTIQQGSYYGQFEAVIQAELGQAGSQQRWEAGNYFRTKRETVAMIKAFQQLLRGDTQ